MLFTQIDNRLLETQPGLAVRRRSERRWHYCKYCYKYVPTFKLVEAAYTYPKRGPYYFIVVLRCCWECGYGLERLHEFGTP